MTSSPATPIKRSTSANDAYNTIIGDTTVYGFSAMKTARGHPPVPPSPLERNPKTNMSVLFPCTSREHLKLKLSVPSVSDEEQAGETVRSSVTPKAPQERSFSLAVLLVVL
jgi:hypothetical protein